MKKTIALLGSTGSIGTQTLRCCKNLGYGVDVLAANRNAALLETQAREFHPRCVVVSDKTAYADLKTRLADTDIRLLAGVEGMCEAASLPGVDVVCNAVVGMVGLRPTLAAIAAKKTVALANKETLVAGGRLVMDAAEENGVDLLPVDSEHSAIFQSLQGNDRAALKKIILTASGGPFRGKTAKELEGMTAADALRHPNWSMGAKITVDSATLMNKGLEFIEAMWLFGLSPDQIEIVVHPQSVVHSAVEYADGAVIAQMGTPDMAVPIQYALTWPHRAPTDARRLSLTDYGSLTFEKPDCGTFVCLDICIEAARRSGLYPCAVNAANEYAVGRFLAGELKFLDIGRCVGYILERFSCNTDELYTLEEVLEAEDAARALAEAYCARR
ncbi:1-deoxy-D-xylulose-5-phosphate reductoisomerase [Anaerotruncus massiliensis (ex Liu et al. 2021)]|uniref:1-deoxy-D-xylulose 5-phosphate reductoisomerase n=2 Tax=Anaerotruncus TaxID=244127 RepID=A0A498CQU8_9FIRM|nr:MULTISPECIES: 1-deoxy-D-xylulose-5-phosphate reductoisomerase [Anaerotruncus]MBC3937414.1 1-deoxy-D-xylulose-5-phosphate reductoisomerase [Anaerotruncus massiliensis (ex Togo et al. 2019)]RLL14536.1 1-deoxy-D-xylulose-5-phosphate reductoisomerase [Anaerotruncus massiliensis (ex Liu et al. 2021)]